MKKLVAFVLLLIFACLPLSLFGCKQSTPTPKTELFYFYFGTESAITEYEGLSDSEFERMCYIVEDELSRYHSLLDIYYSYSGVTNLKDVNEAGGKTTAVSAQLCDFLLYAKDMYEKTAGRVNIAMGSVLSLWHDEREAAKKPGAVAKLPDQAALSEAAKHTDINNLIIDREECTVTLADPNMRLDVGALGKGYVAKRITDRLVASGFSSFILNLGGNISAVGTKSGGERFAAGIKNPSPTSSLDRNVARLELFNKSLSTSGDYENFYTVEGVRYHHIIDPDTQMPSAYGYRSVTILGADPSITDALSTALFTVSVERGRAIAESLCVSVFWLHADGRIEYTDGFTFI